MKDILTFDQRTYADMLNTLYWKENLSLQKIAAIEKTSMSSIYNAMKEYNIPRRGRVIVNLNPSPTLAYVLGVLYGDGCVLPNTMRLRVTDEAFAKSFSEAMQSIGFRVTFRSGVKPTGFGIKSLYEVCGHSKMFADWFRELNFHKIEEIFSGNIEMWKAFIRGFYESDGSMGKDGNTNPHPNIRNTNKRLLDFALKGLNILKIKASLLGPYSPKKNGKRKDMYTLQVSRRYCRNFFDAIMPCIRNMENKNVKDKG